MKKITIDFLLFAIVHSDIRLGCHLKATFPKLSLSSLHHWRNWDKEGFQIRSLRFILEWRSPQVFVSAILFEQYRHWKGIGEIKSLQEVEEELIPF